MASAWSSAYIRAARLTWRRLEMHTARSAADLPPDTAGKSNAAMIAITAMTTKSSIRLKPRFISFELFFQKRAEQINRQRQERGRVVLARHFVHGLEITQLQRNRLLGDQRGGLDHFLSGLKFAFRVHDFCAPFAFGFGLLGHRAFHAV